MCLFGVISKYCSIISLTNICSSRHFRGFPRVADEMGGSNLNSFQLMSESTSISSWLPQISRKLSNKRSGGELKVSSSSAQVRTKKQNTVENGSFGIRNIIYHHLFPSSVASCCSVSGPVTISVSPSPPYLQSPVGTFRNLSEFPFQSMFTLIFFVHCRVVASKNP